MRNFSRYSVALFCVAILSSCAAFTKSREQNLKMAGKAQTPAELVEALGAPQERRMRGDVEEWHYDVYSMDSTRTYPYTAKVQSDKVLSFYADSSHESEEERDLRAGKKLKTHTRFEVQTYHPGDRRPTGIEN